MLPVHGEVDRAGIGVVGPPRRRRLRRLPAPARALRGERADRERALRHLAPSRRRPSRSTRCACPTGLAIGVFAELPKVRALRVTPAGDLLASAPREGRVVLLERDADGDGRSDGTRDRSLEGLNRPHGLDLHDGWLYVAETDAVGRVRFDAAARAGDGRARARRHRAARRRQPLDAHGALRSRRLAVRLDRLELQRLRRGGRAARGDLRFRPDGSERRDLRDRPAQLRRLRLAARRRASSTRPTTAATCSATTSRPAS